MYHNKRGFPRLLQSINMVKFTTIATVLAASLSTHVAASNCVTNLYYCGKVLLSRSKSRPTPISIDV